jgi:CBS domain-containing protein
VQVSDVMTKASVTESADESLRDAAARMWSQQTGSLLVMDGEKLVGIITERDVMKAVARGTDVDSTSVRSIMSDEVVTVAADTSLHEAARLMALRWIRHLPVVDKDTVVGMVSQRDLVGVFAALSKDPDADELATDELVRERRLARIEHGDLD